VMFRSACFFLYALHAPRKSVANRPAKRAEMALFDQSDVF
jgi:hypothetical protein